MLSQEDIAKVLTVLDPSYGVDTLYVYGSQASGRDRPGSDVDLAVILRDVPDAMALVRLRQDLCECLNCEVDLVLIDHASPILFMQVLRHGKVLVDANPLRRANLEARAFSEYADLRKIRAPVERALVRRHYD